MVTEKVPKSCKKFHCEKCDYTTSRKSSFEKHCETIKHGSVTPGDAGDAKVAKSCNYQCDICQKEYISRNGLWRHKKTCNSTMLIVHSKEITPELILSVMQQNKELQTLVIEQNKTIVDLAKNTNNINTNNINTNNINSNNINSHNKSFNLQFFLNETCKDAMNIMDFVDSLKIQLSDLEKVGEMGYVNGISNIIVKNLKSLDVTQRPVHCADAKREVLYVKDENKWEKESEENVKIKKAIKRVAYKNSKMLLEFRKAHPDCGKSDSKYADQYNKLVVESMTGGEDKEDKIVKNIAKVVIIEK